MITLIDIATEQLEVGIRFQFSLHVSIWTAFPFLGVSRFN